MDGDSWVRIIAVACLGLVALAGVAILGVFGWHGRDVPTSLSSAISGAVTALGMVYMQSVAHRQQQQQQRQRSPRILVSDK